MRLIRRGPHATVLLLISAAMPAIARAQAAASPPQPAATPVATVGPADIIVTAQKRRQSANDVPISITAVSGDTLTRKGINTVQDLVKLTPGLSFVESGKSVPVFSLRGVGFFDTSIGARPTVSVYTDEAPVPFSVEAVGASLDLERVEVLKGPQGTLFGQNATGGAINYIAAKPTTVLKAGVTGSISRFDTGDLQGYISGPLTSTLSARIAVRGVRSDGWQQSYTRDDTLGRQRLFQGRVLLAWAPSDRLKVNLNVNGFYDGSDTQAAQLLAFLPKNPRFSASFPGLQTYPHAPHDDRDADWDVGTHPRADNGFVQSILRADYQVSSALTLTSLSAYSHEGINQLTDADGTTYRDIDLLVRGALKSLSTELRASGNVGPLQYIIGANYAHDRTLENSENYFPYSTTVFAASQPPAPLYTQDGLFSRQRFDTKAVFGNVDYKIVDRVTLHGGVRYTKADLDYTACTKVIDPDGAAAFTGLIDTIRRGAGLGPIPALLPGQCHSLDAQLSPEAAVGTLNQGNVSWRTGVDFAPTSHNLIYFSVSKGYKAGSVQTAAVTANSQLLPVTQESVVAYEAGVKLALFDRAVQFNAAAFYYDYRNKQVSGRAPVPVFGPLTVLVNVPRSRIAGAEAQATFNRIKRVSLTLAGTYLNTKVTSDFVNYSLIGTVANYRGNAFPYTPKWQLVADSEYRLPLANDRTAFFGANVNYRSATNAGFGNEALLAIPSYVLLDLQAGIEGAGGKWRASLFGHNVTNAYYLTNVATGGDSLHVYTGRPATYGIQFSFRM